MQFSVMMNKTKFEHRRVVVQKLAPAAKPKTDKPKWPAAKKEEIKKEEAKPANFAAQEGKAAPKFGYERTSRSLGQGQTEINFKKAGRTVANN